MVPVEFFVVVGNNQITNINIHLGEVFSSIYSKAYCCLSEMRDSRPEYTFGT